jgi:hypothetical protein
MLVLGRKTLSLIGFERDIPRTFSIIVHILLTALGQQSLSDSVGPACSALSTEAAWTSELAYSLDRRGGDGLMWFSGFYFVSELSWAI